VSRMTHEPTKPEPAAPEPDEEAPEPVETPAVTAEASELEAERKRNEELLSRLKYLQAEFENYRKRVTRETETVVRFANEALLARLLPVLDDFDAALAHLNGEESKGVRMVRDNVLKALRDAGLEEIPAEGQMFDPYVHDCIQQVPDPEREDGLVKEVVRRGYRVQDHILRPAQVIVVNNRGETHG
jgi:molecular chaperone GrpE